MLNKELKISVAKNKNKHFNQNNLIISNGLKINRDELDAFINGCFRINGDGAQLLYNLFEQILENKKMLEFNDAVDKYLAFISQSYSTPLITNDKSISLN